MLFDARTPHILLNETEQVPLGMLHVINRSPSSCEARRKTLDGVSCTVDVAS